MKQVSAITQREEIAKGLARRAQEDKRLYEKYGKPLEQKHHGEFVAIGPDGNTILGTDDAKVLQKAVEAFGRGNFAFTIVGFRTLGQWLLCKQ